MTSRVGSAASGVNMFATRACIAAAQNRDDQNARGGSMTERQVRMCSTALRRICALAFERSARLACAFAVVVGTVGPGSSVATAQSLGFPIKNQNPYTAPITSVLDHSACGSLDPIDPSVCEFYYKSHAEVVAYTGEKGSGAPRPTERAPGYCNPTAPNTPFRANGAYMGTGGDPTVLNYRGHSGYDFGYAKGISIIAPAGGTLRIPVADPVNRAPGGIGADPWCNNRAFYMDHVTDSSPGTNT